MTYRISSEMIECPGGMPAFLARPEGAVRSPAVILMHERYGLVQHAKDLAERCARDGYVTAMSCWRRISFIGIATRNSSMRAIRATT
jgi:hypothetical protein